MKSEMKVVVHKLIDKGTGETVAEYDGDMLRIAIRDRDYIEKMTGVRHGVRSMMKDLPPIPLPSVQCKV